jgi:sugar diacid utilization regulator
MATGHGVQPYLVQTVSTDRETFGYLMVGSTALGPVDHTTFQGARLVLALRLLIERSVAEAEERAGRDLLMDALLHRGGGRTSAALATRLGYEAHGPAVIVAVRVRTGDGTRREGAGRRDTSVIREELRGGGRGLVGAIGAEVIAILRPEDAEPRARRILGRVAPELGVAVGISDARHDLRDLEPGYREALVAVALAEGSPSGLLRFADLGLHRLLFDVAHVDRVEEHIQRWIGPLLRYDAAHQARLVETLACFLTGEGHKDTARTLSIHPSTLKYRLRRIREILDVDFTRADVRFNIELALRLKEGLRNLHRDGGPPPAHLG